MRLNPAHSMEFMFVSFPCHCSIIQGATAGGTSGACLHKPAQTPDVLFDFSPLFDSIQTISVKVKKSNFRVSLSAFPWFVLFNYIKNTGK